MKSTRENVDASSSALLCFSRYRLWQSRRANNSTRSIHSHSSHSTLTHTAQRLHQLWLKTPCRNPSSPHIHTDYRLYVVVVLTIYTHNTQRHHHAVAFVVVAVRRRVHVHVITRHSLVRTDTASATPHTQCSLQPYCASSAASINCKLSGSRGTREHYQQHIARAHSNTYALRIHTRTHCCGCDHQQ